MKTTGMVRKVNKLGGFVIPKEIRKNLGIDANQQMELYVEDQRIILVKLKEECIICGENYNLMPFDDKFICRNCINRFSLNCRY